MTDDLPPPGSTVWKTYDLLTSPSTTRELAVLRGVTPATIRRAAQPDLSGLSHPDPPPCEGALAKNRLERQRRHAALNPPRRADLCDGPSPAAFSGGNGISARGSVLVLEGEVGTPNGPGRRDFCVANLNREASSTGT